MNRIPLLALASSLTVLLGSVAARATTVSADFGMNLTLDGSQYYATSSSPFDPSQTSFTAEAWFKTTSSSSNQRIVSQEAGTGTGRSWLYLYNGKLATLLGGTTISGKTSVSTNTWHHAALVYDRARHRVTLYLDGVADAVGTVFAESANGPLVFGVNPALNGYYYTGRIDEVRIWSRARGAMELQKDMNLVLSGSESKLTAYYQFNDNATSMRAKTDKTTFSTLCWNGSVSGQLPGSDTSGATPTYALVSQGTLGTVSISSSGKFTYTAGSTKGYDTFTYSITSSGTTATQSIRVSVGTLSRRFTYMSGSSNPLWGMINNEWTFARFVDLDNDGDMDARIVDYQGAVSYYQNTGTAYSPSFSNATDRIPFLLLCRNGTWSTTSTGAGSVCTVNGTSIDVTTLETDPYLVEDFVDYRDNGTWDDMAIYKGFDNVINLYLNPGDNTSTFTLSSSGSPFTSTPTISNISDFAFADIYETGYPAAVFFDISKSTKPLVSRLNAGNVAWGQPTTDLAQNFALASGTGLAARQFAIGDIDGDGAWDVAIGGSARTDANVDLYINTGTSLSPSFGSVTAMFDQQGAQWTGAPALVDLDGDGDLDLFVAGYEGPSYYRNDTKFYVTDQAPTVSNVTISGVSSTDVLAGQTSTVSYTYSDADSDSEAGTTYVWLLATDSSGSGATSVSTSATFRPTASQVGQYVQVCVTPSDWINVGTQVCSAYEQIAPSLIWYQDASYGGTSAAVDYSASTNGTCVNMSGYSMNDMASSFQLFAPSSYTASVAYYVDENCSGGVTGSTTSAETEDQVSYVGDSWNDKISSFRVMWLNASSMPSASGCFYPGTTLLKTNLASLTLQSDGDLVLSKGFPADGTTTTAWHTNTANKNVQAVCFQTDGNLVIYNTSGTAIWSSGSENKGVSTMILQTDCNLVMYDGSNSAKWATSTNNCWN